MLLFINSVNPNCGVYQYGHRLYSLIECPELVDYVEVETADALARHLETRNYRACILNYHPSLFPWWVPPVKTYYIYHEADFPFDPSTRINTDPTSDHGIPRPLSLHRVSRPPPDVPTFGSFGFGFENKGFERIITMVQSQYDVARIQFVIPFARYGDSDGARARDVVRRCQSLINKRGITLEVSHEFASDADLVALLASTTMNLFLYDKMPGRGCSSVIDFALAAGRPIGISDSEMFRHIYSDAICAYKRPLKDIVVDGDIHIRPFLEKWTASTLRTALLDRVRDSL